MGERYDMGKISPHCAGPIRCFNTLTNQTGVNGGVRGSGPSCCTRKASPESVGFEGCVGVDVVMQPPLHRHVPVTHAMSNLHTEVCVVAVDVLDGFEVITLLS